jgi:hypothetical protein
MSRGFDLSYISDNFERASHGYLSTPANQLALIFAGLPRASCIRERSIEAAIAWGMRNPRQWDHDREPMKLTRRPDLWHEAPSWSN